MHDTPQVTAWGTRERARSALGGLVVLSLAFSVTSFAQAAPAWITDVPVSPPAEEYVPDDVAMAPNGTAVVLLRRLVGLGLLSTTHRPGGTWSEPEVVSLESGADAVVDVDAKGNFYAAWIVANPPNRIEYTMRPAGGDWGPPTILSGSGSASEPTIDVNRSGDVGVTWREEAGGTAVIRARRKDAGEAWTVIRDLSAPHSVVGQPVIAVDDQGRTTVMWARGSPVAVQSAQRGTSDAWTPPVTIVPSGANDPIVGVDAAGTVHAAWLRSDGTNKRVWAATNPLGGGWNVGSKPLSGAGQDAYTPQLAVSPTGAAATVWVRSNGENYIVQGAVRPAGGTWSAASNLSAVGFDANQPQVVVDRRGNALATWQLVDTIGRPQARRRAASATSWGRVADLRSVTENGTAPLPAMDARGNAFAAFDTGEYKTFVSQFDGEGPRTAIARPTAAFTLGDPAVSWRGVDVWSEVELYRVRSASATPTGSFVRNVWLASTPARSGTFGPVSPGTTSCFSARGTDAVGNTGAFSAERCTAKPLNDRALRASDGWLRRNVAAAYRGTLTRTNREGEVLTSVRLKAKRIALVATRGPDAGRVAVYFAGSLIRYVTLTPTSAQDAGTTYRRQVIPITTFSTRSEGVVRIVTDNAKPVSIEGLGISAR